jgi:hypothetical protein
MNKQPFVKRRNHGVSRSVKCFYAPLGCLTPIDNLVKSVHNGIDYFFLNSAYLFLGSTIYKNVT